MTYEGLLKEASKKALKQDMEVEAVKLLLLELSELSPSAFYLNLKSEVSEAFIALFNEKLSLYIDDKIPVQHILGFSYFYGRKLKVSADTLIPRPETEQLVEHVLIAYDTYFENEEVKVVDLGTGSGCIAITLKLEAENMQVEAYDISEKALDVARKNAVDLNAQVTFGLSDWFSNIHKKYDIIVANPPYIPDSEVVDDIVNKEPNVALYGGKDGLDYYETILKNAHQFLNKKGLIAFEHGFQQKKDIYEMAKKCFKDAVIIQHQDLNLKDRFTLLGIGGVLSNEI